MTFSKTDVKNCGVKMMNDETYTAGETAGDDLSGLKQPQLITRQSRDLAELETISLAYDKYIYKVKKPKGGEWLIDEFIRRVHYEMFGVIWDWAGKYRTAQVNIGVDWNMIPEQIKMLCGDFHYWNASPSTMSILEIAARLQNRLTRIHPFKNGNGRHARLITDIFFHSRNHRLPNPTCAHLL